MEGFIMCKVDLLGFGFQWLMGVTCGRCRLTMHKRRCAPSILRCAQ